MTAMTAAIQPELAKEIESWPVRASRLAITTEAEFVMGAEMLQAIKRFRQTIAETFDPVIKRAHEAHAAALAAKKKHEEPLTEAERLLKARMAAYREEEARRLAALREAEMARRMDEAIDAALSGDDTMATMMLAATAVATPSAAPPKADGVTFRVVWRAEVVDVGQFLAWVVEHRAYHLVAVDTAALNTLARAQRESMAIPGVRVVRHEIAAVRS